MSQKLHYLLRLIHSIEDYLLVILLISMMLLACLQIFLRNLFGEGIIWADPILRVMVLWLGLIGALAATRDNKHITIDVVSRLVKPTLKKYLAIFAYAFSTAVTALIAYHTFRFVLSEYETGTVAFLKIPAWILESIIPFAFTLMMLRFAIHFVNSLLKPGQTDQAKIQ